MPVSSKLAEGLAADVVAHYAEAERVLLARIAKSLGKGIDGPRWAQEKLVEIHSIQKRAKALLKTLETTAGKVVSDSLNTAWARGITAADADLIGLLDKTINPLTSNVPGSRALTRLVAETTDKVIGTHPRILRSTMDAYRSVVAEASGQVLLGTQTRRDATQAALDAFAKKGVAGLIDKAGRGWDMASYTEMAVRTSTAHAAVSAHMDRLQANGWDLIIISDAPQECELCRPWEGKVLSISGSSVGAEAVASLEEATSAGLFHPNCRHSTGIYIPGVTKPMTDTADPQGDADRQKLRSLERQVRADKRVQSVALSPEAAKKAELRIRATQAKIREHVRATSAKRAPGREQIGLPKPVVKQPFATSPEWASKEYDWILKDQGILDADAKFAAQEWQGNGYKRVQGSLSGGKPTGEVSELIGILDDNMKSLGDSSAELYRGQTEGLDNLKIGDVFKSKLYTSTTSDPIQAAGFSKSSGSVIGGIRQGESATILRIDVGDAKGFAVPHSPEYEVILARGTKFRVEGISEQTINGVKLKMVDVVSVVKAPKVVSKYSEWGSRAPRLDAAAARTPHTAGNGGELLTKGTLSDDEARDMLSRALEFKDSVSGMSARISNVRVGRLETSWEFKVYASSGDAVGKGRRIVYGENFGAPKTVVEHEFFNILLEKQGTGFSTRYGKHVEDWYASQGVTEVRLNANIDIGGYAWARQGYDWKTSTQASSVLERVRILIHDGDPLKVKIEQFQINVVMGKGHIPTPYEVSQLGYTEGATMWPGKQGMLGSNWDGVKHLVPVP